MHSRPPAPFHRVLVTVTAFAAALPGQPATTLDVVGEQLYALRQDGRARVSKPAGAAIELALGWLAKHQDADGDWDPAEFMRHDRAGPRCDGRGVVYNGIGVTGLALLAFLADGNTARVAHTPPSSRARSPG